MGAGSRGSGVGAQEPLALGEGAEVLVVQHVRVPEHRSQPEERGGGLLLALLLPQHRLRLLGRQPDQQPLQCQRSPEQKAAQQHDGLGAGLQPAAQAAARGARAALGAGLAHHRPALVAGERPQLGAAGGKWGRGAGYSQRRGGVGAEPAWRAEQAEHRPRHAGRRGTKRRRASVTAELPNDPPSAPGGVVRSRC